MVVPSPLVIRDMQQSHQTTAKHLLSKISEQLRSISGPKGSNVTESPTTKQSVIIMPSQKS